jgi:hypothetical protein
MDLCTNREANSLLTRIGLAVAEGRREHEPSERQLAALSGGSRATIHKLDRGGYIRPELLMRLATVIAIADVYTPPRRSPDVAEIARPVDATLVLQDGQDAFIRTWTP